MAQLLPRPRGDAVAEAAALPASDGLLTLSYRPRPPIATAPVSQFQARCHFQVGGERGRQARHQRGGVQVPAADCRSDRSADGLAVTRKVATCRLMIPRQTKQQNVGPYTTTAVFRGGREAGKPNMSVGIATHPPMALHGGCLGGRGDGQADACGWRGRARFQRRHGADKLGWQSASSTARPRCASRWGCGKAERWRCRSAPARPRPCSNHAVGVEQEPRIARLWRWLPYTPSCPWPSTRRECRARLRRARTR